MASLSEVDFDPFKASALDLALAAEGITGAKADLARSIYQQESGGGRNTKTSNAGAVGGMQIIPATFQQVADKGWDIKDPVHNARAGLRYISQLYEQAGGDPALTAAGYYGGPGGLEKARRGVAVSDPRNPGAPTTLQYGQQVAARLNPLMRAGQAVTNAIIPSAQAGEKPKGARLEEVDFDPFAEPTRGGGASGSWDAPEAPGVLASIGGGLGSGLGKTVLGAQHYVGKGAQALGADRAGRWLVDDAAAGRARLNAEIAPYKAAHPLAAGGGELAGEIGATLPVGGVLGGGVKALAPMIGRAAPVADALGNAIASGGMTLGRTGGNAAANLGLRAAGGAVTGGASAALVEPGSGTTGALIGAALPPVLMGAGKAAGALASGVRALRTPEEAKAAAAILQAGGIKTPQQVAQARQLLTAQGPNIIPEAPTVPQVLQNPGISQLARTLRNAGETSMLAREQAQDAARLAVLDRVSPVAGTAHDAAEAFGADLAPKVLAADAAARARTSAAFEAVDPFLETQFHLPIGAMGEAKDKFLGPGTFGSGSRAAAAIGEARKIGEETLEAVKPVVAGADRQQTLMQAVRSAGGINKGLQSSKDFAGELRDLSQSGGRSAMSAKSGKSVDWMAQLMHEAGFIDNADPASLMNALREAGGGARIVSGAADETRAHQALLEAAMGDAPAAEAISKTVPFEHLQNLRSSIGEAARQAESKGADREAAALKAMRDEIDKAVEQVAAGRGRPNEHFPADSIAQWETARKLKLDQVQRFRTGPQASMFRSGGDGLPAAQGAELAPKFFNGRPSQTADIRAFSQVADDASRAGLKNYAITDLASQTDRLGRLTNNKVGNWVDRRSGALAGLFSGPELAQVQGVARDLGRADSAMSLGLATGSNTAQNAQSALSLGLLDHPLLNAAASRVPGLGRISGPLLGALKESAKKQKVQQLGGLLADPAALDAAIAKALAQAPRGPVARGLIELRDAATPALYRGAPLLLSGP